MAMPRARRGTGPRGRIAASPITESAAPSQTASTKVQKPDEAEPAIAESRSKANVATAAQTVPGKPKTAERDGRTRALIENSSAATTTNVNSAGRS